MDLKEKENIDKRVDDLLSLLLIKTKEPNFKDFIFDEVYPDPFGMINWVGIKYRLRGIEGKTPLAFIAGKENEVYYLDEVRRRTLNYDPEPFIKHMYLHIDALKLKISQQREQIFQYWIFVIMLTSFTFGYIVIF